MVRPHLQLHPPRPPAPAQPAATLLLLRHAEAGFEVLMSRRSEHAPFAPGVYVFPGGLIDASDAELLPLASLPSPASATPSPTALAAVAALRETFEELGILLARSADGHWVDPATVSQLDRRAPLAAQLRHHGLRLAADLAWPLCRWVTDRDLPRRFDVDFLVAPAPPGQRPQADNHEQFAPTWIRPSCALAEHQAGRFPMIFPTVRTLEHLAAYADAAAVLKRCQAQGPLFASTPRGGWLRGQEVRYMEHEPPFGELELVCPDGQILHHLDLSPTRPSVLLRHIQRLTAPNPGLMTGPGTNTYIVGQPETGYGIIDPGPDIGEHRQRILEASGGGDIRWIVCTHSHPDHAPGAWPLQAAVGYTGRPRPPVLGLPSAPTSRSCSHFRPDRTLQDEEQLTLTGTASESQDSHTLRILHTPGHAANHLCLVLEQDGLLFSGDHILNGSTTVIDPPDGDMDAYLHSLDRLAHACATWGITHILPAHGHVLGNAPDAIARLKAHRLAREAKIRAAIAAQPEGTVADWVRLAYDDVPESLWPVAERSLLAHLARIQRHGLA